ncbi:MAG: FtsW/RodA/SpoVE family cell cycle protein, partial [Chloroflexota bacterium]
MIGNRTHTTTRARRNSPRQKSINLNTDVLLLLATFTLLLFGALMVYSASWDFSFLIYDDASYMFTRQMTWMILGIIGAVITAIFDYHYYRKLAVPAMAVTLLGLITVLILSEVRYGATRTISGGSFMPSELAKLVTIIYLSVWLYSKRNQLHDMSMGMVPLGGILGSVSGLILMQPDLSAA